MVDDGKTLAERAAAYQVRRDNLSQSDDLRFIIAAWDRISLDWPWKLRAYVAAEEECSRLRIELASVKDAVQDHHDQTSDDRCWLDDLNLYRNVGIEPKEGQTALPPKESFLASCERYYEQRQHPDVVGKCPMPGRMTIAQLTEECSRLRAENARLQVELDRERHATQ